MSRNMLRLSILFVFCLHAVLFGRENPFVPVEDAALPVKQERNASGIVILTDDEVAEIDSEPVPEPESRETSASAAKSVKPQIINYQQIRLVITGQSVRIETKDALKKDFAIANPTRIILDFSSSTEYPSRKKKLEVAPFSELRIGSHKGFYRVVLELKKPMKYAIAPFKYGYNLTLQQ